MRKTALLLALLMIVGQAYGLCYPTTVDNVLDSKSKSDIRPVQDTAKIASVANRQVNKVMVSKPTTTMLKPIRAVKNETIKGTKKVTNTLWDVLTLRSFREKKK